MGRSVILSNGRLAVGLNEKGLVHDFYYPYVGLDNLTTARSIHHKIGIWIDGEFSWTDSEDWEHETDFSSNALISDIVINNQNLGITLHLNDFVDHEVDAFCRIVKVSNNRDTDRSIKIFMHQVFEISRAGRADTALYVPDSHYILDYKGRCTLLIGGKLENGQDFDQYAVGNYGIEGKEGTFRDAEDGELSGHAVEHGGVDSVIRFSLEIPAQSTASYDYWIAASDSQFNGETILNLLKQGLSKRLEANQTYWEKWFSVGAERLNLIPEQYRDMAKKSLLVIKAHTDDRGGIIASCDSSIYNNGRDYYSYVWPRDGAYAMWPLIRLGFVDEPKAFFRFCKDILTPIGCLMHKYQPDQAIGSTWHPLVHDNRQELAIQEDETAVVITMLGEFDSISNDDEFSKEMFDSFVIPAANFLCSYIDEVTGLPHASYDLWEEKFLSSTYTTAVVYRALLAAADFAERFGNEEQTKNWRKTAAGLLEKREIFMNPERAAYRKGFLLNQDESLTFDDTLDLSSLYGVITYGYFDSEDIPKIREALNEIQNTIAQSCPSGGVPRYEQDNYFRVSEEYPGNPWIITTLWLAQFYLRFNQPEKSKVLMEWAQYHALNSGVLPEQINPADGSPVSVTPLVWSHAEFINTVLDYSHISSQTKMSS